MMVPFIKSFFKKFILVILVYGVMVSIFANTFKNNSQNINRFSNQVNVIQKNRQEIYKLINNKEYQKTKQGKTIISIYKMTTCTIMGEACTDNPNDANKNYHKSLVSYAGNLLAYPYINPPASGTYWLYDSAQNTGFIPKTYAAEGVGFGALKPFINLWKVFRDFAYMLLVLVLITIGFMVMFRMKLNPQTVISVENALPKIIVALLLVTFSFAIAGFLIDFMYVAIALAISLLSNNNTYYSANQFMNEYLNADFLKLGSAFFPTKTPNSVIPGLSGLASLLEVGNSLLAILGPVNAIIRAVGGFIGAWWGWMHSWIVLGPATQALDNLQFVASLGKIPGFFIWLILGPIWAMITGGLGAFLLPQLLLALFILLTIFLLIFRIFSLLFRAYLQIILFVIFAPILLIFEAIPGKSVFSWWFKNLLAEIITFPLIIIIFIVGYIITGSFAAAGNTMWAPPFLYGMDPNAFSVVLGIGLMFLIPDIIKLVKELLGVKGLPLSFGPGMFFAGAGTAIGGGMGVLGQFGSISLATGAIGKMMTGRRHGLSGMVGALFGQEFEASRKGGAAATGTNVPKADAPPSTQ